jgi:hypothetical protein
MTKRDDFLAATKRTLAARVGHRCSNPGCMRPTSGPALDDARAVNVGQAAHITAAAPGGKRYDSSLTPEERRAEANGIWLCDLCAGLIDEDEKRFTVELLRRWKNDAIDRALEDIATAAPGSYRRPVISLELDDDDRAFLRSLALPGEDNVDAVAPRMREATERDIAAFRGTKDWPAHTIALNLTLNVGGRRHGISIEGMANAIDVAETLNLVAPPGMGKTTTLVQLTGTILEAGHIVPALVPLGEWSDRLEDFFSFLTRRNAYRTFRPQHFMQLAYHGRLVLLLDGWNELDPASRVRAARDLKVLRREYPLLGIVIGTRRHQLPISGPTVEIEALSENQQIELARALRGREGEALIDQAWRTPGVRELISIPLYLTSLLRSAPGARIPQTKEEVLRLFVTQHEQSPEKAEILRKELYGFHDDMLIGLALEANRTANTVLSDTNARRVISEVETGLAAGGQLSTPPQPGAVIDVLVNGHILVRSSSGGGVAFQHQQFQEWYASLEVGRLMLQAANGDADARARLRITVLNWPAWEESVLFGCERLSRENAAGAQAVAAAIRDALGIDPMLAAEMIFRSAPEVWPQISAEVVRLATRWHTPGRPDRAARFMITTGQPEFAPHIWPLLSSSDNQIYLAALRAARRFRPSVLCGNAEDRLAALPDEKRPHIVAEIASNSGFDGMELAARVAQADQNANVVSEVLQALQFRRADRLVREILETASDEVWQLVARNGYPDELSDPAQNARLIELRQAQAAAETSPLQLLGNLVAHPVGSGDPRSRVTAMIAAADFPLRDDRANMMLHRAFERFPEAVNDGLLQRIASGLELPYDAPELLESTTVVDEGPVAAAALDSGTPERIAWGAFAVIGPTTVGALMDRLFALHDERSRNPAARGQAENQAWSNEYQRVKAAVGKARSSSFIPALLARSNTDAPARIALLADLLACHGRQGEGEQLAVGNELRPALLNTVQHWIDTLLGSAQANRHQFADVVNAVTRCPDPQFVPGLERMLARDIADWTRAREEFRRSPQRGGLSPDVTHSHMIEYQRAFAAIGDKTAVEVLKSYLTNLQFGMQAAGALFEIWNRNHQPNTKRLFGSWRDYSRAKALRGQRRDALSSLPTTEFAEAIFEVVRSMGIASADGAAQQHAISLAVVGLGLPHGSKRAEIDSLIELPVPFESKQRLLMASAMAGEVVPKSVLAAGLQELLEAGKTQPYRLQENHGVVMGWVELFAFSDRPEAVLGVIEKLPEQYRQYPRGLHRLLSALGQSPHEGTLAVLSELAGRDPRMMADHDWLDAMIKIGSEESARSLITLICDGQLTNAPGADTFRLVNHLGHLARQFPAIKDEMLRRYRQMPAGRPKSIIEAALVELADTAIVLALLEGYAADARGYDGGLSHAVRKVALEQRPIEGWLEGAYEEFSVSLASFRQQLFALAVGDGPKAALAERCLISIEKLRDEHGRLADEPHHPDISSGRRWPLLTAQ